MTNTRLRPKVWSMFDRIAHRYDLLNRLLSGGQDIIWRKRLLQLIPQNKEQIMLDVATGTGDVLLTLLQESPYVVEAHGIDMSKKMLQEANRKIQIKNLQGKAQVQVANAEDLPFEKESFDLTTIAFGIRNLPDYEQGIQEMFRILKLGGRALILEFSLPRNRILLPLYLFYFRHILPLVGGLISGDQAAYRYLNQTVETFPYGEAFVKKMNEAGFSNVKVHLLTFGIATIYQGDKL